MDLRSTRQEEGLNHNNSEFRSYLNTNLSEHSGLTEETSRAINAEISSQMSTKLEEMKSDLNAHMLDAINSAIEEKVTIHYNCDNCLPSIKNAVGNYSAKNTNLFLRSDGPHPSNSSQVHPQRDFRSNGLHPEKVSQVAQDAQKDFPRLVAMSSNRMNYRTESSVDSD